MAFNLPLPDQLCPPSGRFVCCSSTMTQATVNFPSGGSAECSSLVRQDVAVTGLETARRWRPDCPGAGTEIKDQKPGHTGHF